MTMRSARIGMTEPTSAASVRMVTKDKDKIQAMLTPKIIYTIAKGKTASPQSSEA